MDGLPLTQTLSGFLFPAAPTWSRDHYDRHALLTSMKDMVLLLYGLHCHQADGT